MCNYTIKARHAAGLGAVAEIDGRPVLQPASNRVVTVEAGRPFKKPVASAPRVSPPPLPLPCALSAPPPCTGDKAAAHTDAEVIVVVTGSSPSAVAATTPVTLTKLPIPASPKPKVAAKTVHRRSEDPNGLNSSGEIKPTSPKSAPRPAPALRKKSKRSGQAAPSVHPHVTLLDRLDLKAVPGSIAAAQREQATLRQAQRKMRIAHYGRTPGKAVLVNSSGAADDGAPEEKRCSFITSNSDPIYVAYHDDEWGVPVHDDKMLFELLVLAGAQVGLDWTTILKRREDFRAAFAGFEAEMVAKFNERQIAAISAEYGIEVGRVRSVVDNSIRILQVRKEFGSLNEYLWGFVNHRPISTRYSSCRKIPVKTSKSEAISKDMVRRGFRFTGPTVVHSFMQAAGLTNDHLLSCPRHLHLQQQQQQQQQLPTNASSTTTPLTSTSTTSATIL